jgi:transposase, IS30 family
MKNKGKLTALERDRIAVWLARKIPLREIAGRLSRSVSTISDEVKRNSFKGEYHSIEAQALCDTRNQKSRQTNPLKNPKIYQYVVNKLRAGWSPEQIAGRLKRSHQGKTIICHETIYRYIYSPKGKEKHLMEYLTRHHYKRREWHGRYLYRRGIHNRVSIHDRPEEINLKTNFGHWETDVVEGKGHLGGIQTMLERKTRYYTGKLMPVIDSEYGIFAQENLLTRYPRKATLSVTMDNGKENYNHLELKHLGIQTYFCDPQCAWQKGSNENHNGVLRRYIPKKTDLSTISQLELDAIFREINDRPRKCLAYETPSEAFKRELEYLSISERCSDRD